MLSHLLPEIWKRIFKFCDVSTLKDVACLNSTFYHAVKELLWSTIEIPFSDMIESDFADKKKLSNLRYTKALHFLEDIEGYEDPHPNKNKKKKLRANYKKILEHCDGNIVHTFEIETNLIGKQCIPLICTHFPKLKVLKLPRSELAEDEYRALRNFTDLLELDLSYSFTEDDDLPMICAIKTLKVLTIRNTNIGPDNGLAGIGNLTALEELNLNVTEVYDPTLTAIASLPLLKRLYLKRCCQVTDVGVKHICRLPKLETLCLTYASLTNQSLFYLGTVPTLKLLNLSCSYCIPMQIGFTDSGFAYLKNLTRLQELNLNHSRNITDGAMLYISYLTSLKILKLKFNDIGNYGLAYLQGLTKLEELNVCGTKVTNLAISYISISFPRLNNLDICGTEVDDVGINYLLSVKDIRTFKHPYSERSDSSEWDE